MAKANSIIYSGDGFVVPPRHNNYDGWCFPSRLQRDTTLLLGVIASEAKQSPETLANNQLIQSLSLPLTYKIKNKRQQNTQHN
jgi:hypothetical protein